MEKRELEVVLVYVEYDKQAEITEGELPVLAVQEAAPADYPDFIRAGRWSDKGELRFQPHLRAKIEEEYRNVDIAVKAGDREAQNITAVITEPAGYSYQRYHRQEEGHVYFLPPRCWEANPFNKKPQETNIGHYNTIGSEVIRIRFADGKTETMTLVSQVTEEEQDFCQELVFDLAAMHLRLCMDQKSTMTMAMDWSDHLYQDTKEMVRKFCEAFRLLEENPQPQLQPFQDKKPFRKIKKMSARALVEHEIFHKDKVSAISYREELDTFEHRVVKTHLRSLQDMIRIHQNMERLALENEKSRLKAEVGFTDQELEDRIAELAGKEEDRRAELERKLTGKYEDSPRLLCVYIQFRVLEMRHTQEREGLLRYCVTNQSRPEIQIKSQASDGSWKVNLVDCGYRVYDMRKRGWSELRDYAVPGARKTQYLKKVSVPLDCIDAAAMLFHYLDSDEKVITGNDLIGICGDVVEEGYAAAGKGNFSEFCFEFRNIREITLSGGFCDRNVTTVRERYSAAKLGREEKMRFAEALRNHVLRLDLQGNDSENMGFYTEALERGRLLDKLDNRLKDEKGLKEKWGVLEGRLERIQESSLMKSVKDIRTPVKMTNLFAFHPAYQEMYAVMVEDDRKLEGIKYRSEKEEDIFPVAKLADLYEIWCCVKLLLILIQDYGFALVSVKRTEEGDEAGSVKTVLVNGTGAAVRVSAGVAGGAKGMEKDDIGGENAEAGDGKEALKRYIEDVLAQKDFSETQFDLKYKDANGRDIFITIWYNRKVRINKKRLSEENIFAGKKHSHLRPDIILKITCREQSKFFILDAKYRKGKSYDGVKDLCEVAFQKYTLELGHEFLGFPWNRVDGSFVIHSNGDAEVVSVEGTEGEGRIKYDPKMYLGACPDKFARRWLEQCAENKWEVAGDKFREWADWPGSCGNHGGDGNHENRIGIVVANPRENKLTYLLQMIMEQHFGLYQSKCWICGSSDLEIEHKYTEKGYAKYHIKCRNPECGKFTVETHCGNGMCPSHNSGRKLGKHYINYLANSGSGENKRWNVLCPICRQAAFSKENGITGSSPKR